MTAFFVPSINMFFEHDMMCCLWPRSFRVLGNSSFCVVLKDFSGRSDRVGAQPQAPKAILQSRLLPPCDIRIEWRVKDPNRAEGASIVNSGGWADAKLVNTTPQKTRFRSVNNYEEFTYR